MTPLVALDVETTGTHRKRRAYEVAMIRRDDQGERETQFFVHVSLANADPFALPIGRYYERHPSGRYQSARTDDGPDYRTGVIDGARVVSPSKAAHEVARWTHGAYIIGSNPRFDLETLEKLLRKWCLTPGWQYHPGDVACMAGGPPPWKLSAVAAKVGVVQPPPSQQHTALGDARWALAVYDAIIGGAA